MNEPTLEAFIEEYLPLLIQPDYEATIAILEAKLKTHNLSLDRLIARYPNFLTKVRYHLFFFFAHQMSELPSDNNLDLATHYRSLATTYRDRYIDSFAEKQIQEYFEKHKIG